MPWSQITSAEVLQEFSPEEQAQLDSIEAGENLGPILSRVVNAARGSIVAGGGQVDAGAGTIPDQLREDIIAIARWKWLLSLPDVVEALQSKGRMAAHDAAMKRLDDITAGKIKVELPGAAPGAPVNAIEVASSQTRTATRTKLEGL